MQNKKRTLSILMLLASSSLFAATQQNKDKYFQEGNQASLETNEHLQEIEFLKKNNPEAVERLTKLSGLDSKPVAYTMDVLEAAEFVATRTKNSNVARYLVSSALLTMGLSKDLTSEKGLFLITKERAPKIYNYIKQTCKDPKLNIKKPIIFLAANKNCYDHKSIAVTPHCSVLVIGEGLIRECKTTKISETMIARELINIKWNVSLVKASCRIGGSLGAGYLANQIPNINFSPTDLLGKKIKKYIKETTESAEGQIEYLSKMKLNPAQIVMPGNDTAENIVNKAVGKIVSSDVLKPAQSLVGDLAKLNSPITKVSLGIYAFNASFFKVSQWIDMWCDSKTVALTGDRDSLVAGLEVMKAGCESYKNEHQYLNKQIDKKSTNIGKPLTISFKAVAAYSYAKSIINDWDFFGVFSDKPTSNNFNARIKNLKKAELKAKLENIA
ncbi:MAG: hypothetical protein UR26_C0002G0173 [candidate division TM6 bacterium GW2011_GWF2_32_72]|nr:MAG: hypothetical protein UR26_C0002G0173 [candidate division TM6 bacterium GW2011_GWF2_32_72]